MAVGPGDRWLAGEALDGVRFALHEAVEITRGRFRGERGTVLLLMAIEPEPLYLVTLGPGAGDLRVRQADLRAAR